jgi:hypothetical protein
MNDRTSIPKTRRRLAAALILAVIVALPSGALAAPQGNSYVVESEPRS